MIVPRTLPAVAVALLVCLAGVPGLVYGQDRPISDQLANAVLPLPGGLREGAGVLGYRDGGLVELRAGSNMMLCLADDPAREGYHAACYHRDLEPFMARGRELRAQGLTVAAVDSTREAEVMAGRLPMPPEARALYSLTSDAEYEPSSGTAPDMRGLIVFYMPYATEASTGISATPARDRPWLMFPGTYRAHVMIAR